MKMNSEVNKLIHKVTKGKKHIELVVGIQEKDGCNIKVYTGDGVQEYSGLRYEIGSLTKIFTASLIAKEVECKRINLNEPYAIYLNSNRVKSETTIKGLLTHHSGYPSYLPLRNRREQLLLLSHLIFEGKQCVTNPLKCSKEELIDVVETISAYETSKYEYSNINYNILGELLCEINRKSYSDQMQSYLNEELKMSNTSFNPNNLVLGYTRKGKYRGNWYWNCTNTTIASGGLYSDIYDLLKFTKYHREKKYDYLIRMQSILNEATRSYDIGYGWKITKNSKICWHNGGTGCFNTFLGFNEDNNRDVVILSNYRSSAIDELGLALLKQK